MFEDKSGEERTILATFEKNISTFKSWWVGNDWQAAVMSELLSRFCYPELCCSCDPARVK